MIKEDYILAICLVKTGRTNCFTTICNWLQADQAAARFTPPEPALVTVNIFRTYK